MLERPPTRPSDDDTADDGADLVVMPDIAAVYLSCRGDLDVGAVDDLRRRLADGLDRTEEMVVLDCSGVRFTDTSGLRLLLETTRTANARGIRFVVASPSRQLRHLLRLAGVGDFLHIDDYECDVRDQPHPPVVVSRGAPVHAFPVAHAL
jgi:anti-anti-sigma factor